MGGGSASRTDLCLTTHNTHKRQASLYPAGFEPAIPAIDRPQTLALDRSATGIGRRVCLVAGNILFVTLYGNGATC